MNVASRLSVLLLLCACTVAFGQNADSFNQLKSVMQAKEFDRAITLADAYIETNPDNADEATYLQALAAFHANDITRAIEITKQLATKYPKSTWLRKAHFLRAQAHLKQRDYQSAEAIYSAETERLLSNTRKHELASVIIRFADSLAKKPDPNDVGAPPPNYEKAYNLYNKAQAMEIGRDLLDDVMFKKGYVSYYGKNYGRAVNEFRAYVQEFDPDWTGNVGSVERMRGQKRIDPKPLGKHRVEARYRLAKSQLMQNQRQVARQNFEDLLTIVVQELQAKPDDEDLKKYQANTTWQVVRSYMIPHVDQNELERGVKAARDFVAAYRDHRHSFEAIWRIAEGYQRYGRVDQAIEAYEEFAAGKTYALPKGDVATMHIERLGTSAAQLQDRWQKEAVFTVGMLRFNQRRYDDAIEQWNRYINRFPNGPRWSTAQSRIIDAKYMMALDAVTDKQYDVARKRFDQFLTQYPLDQRARQVLFILGQIHYGNAHDLEESNAKQTDIQAAYQAAIDQWNRLVSKYPNTNESSLALYRIGQIFEEKLGDLDKALESYRRLNWGSHAGQARQRVVLMTQKHLTLRTAKTFRSGEAPSVKVNVRNIEKLTVKQYWFDLEAYFRKTHQTKGVENLDIGLIQPDKTWTVDVTDYAKYKPLEQSIDIPFQDKPAGVCIVNVTDEKNLEATTLVIRSDLDLIFKSSRRETLVYVQDMTKNQSAKDVELLITDGKQVIATGTTGEDGVWRKDLKELASIRDVRVFAGRKGHVASNMTHINNLRVSSGLSPKGYIYTDRTAYQPGQTVALKGIVRHVVQGSYEAPEGAKYTLDVNDSQGRLLHREDVTLSKFGTFHTEFPVSSNAPQGRYQVTIRDISHSSHTFSGAFIVQQFKLQKMRLVIDTPQEVYFRGEMIKASLKAEYYWGEPVVNKRIQYHLPDGRTYLADTDEEGQVEVEFDTTGTTPGQALMFRAEIQGEGVYATKSVMLAKLGFKVTVKSNESLILSGEPFDVSIETKRADGEPVGKDLTLYVLRRRQPKVDPVTSAIPWIPRRATPSAEETVEEKRVSTDPKTGRATVRLKYADGGRYILRVAGEDRFDQVVTAQTTVNISDEDDQTKLRIFTDSDTLQVGGKARIRVHSRLKNAIALLTYEGERIIHHQITTLKQGFNDLQLDVDHAHFPNFRVAVAAIDGRELRTAAKDLNVERQLRITLEPGKDVYRPGAKAGVKITVTDQLNRPVEGELSLALVNEALFAQYPDQQIKIMDFFQNDARRRSYFQIGSTCGFEYVAKTKAVDKALVEERERLGRAEMEQQQLADKVAQLKSNMPMEAAELTLEAGRRRPATPRLSGMAGGGFGGGAGGGAAMDDAFGAAPGAPMNAAPAIVDQRRKRSEASRDLYAAGKSAYAYSNGRKTLAKSRNAGSGPGGQPSPRRELPQAGVWLPVITTDAKGQATVEIDLPDSTTEWRLTSRAATVNTLVGQTVSKVITRKDFFVEIKTPRSWQEGDHVNIHVRVHNLTDYKGPVTLTLNATTESKRYYQLKRSVEVDSHGTVEAAFNEIEIPRVHELDLEVGATAPEHSDALAMSVPVRLWGMEYADHGGGTASGNADVFVKLPDKIKYNSRWLTLSIGPSLDRSVVDMALGSYPVTPRPLHVGDLRAPVIRPPHRFGGYAGSELLATVAALQYVKKIKAQPRDIENLTDQARSLISSLIVTQRSDGSWSWQSPQGGSVGWITATSYWALRKAQEQGLIVHNDTLYKALGYLKNQFQQAGANDNDTKSVYLHALSTSKSADFASLNRLHRNRNAMSSPALAYAALGLKYVGHADFSAEIIDVLVTKAQTVQVGDRQLAYWKGTKHHWMSDDIGSTALALLALSSIRPESPLTKQAAEWLLDQRGCHGFTAAKVRGVAVAALAAYYSSANAQQADYRLDVLINGKKVHTIQSANTKTTELVSVPVELIKDGENHIEYRMAGQGSYTYAATIRGFSPDLKDPKSWSYPYVQSRAYYHSNLEYRGRKISASSTSPVKNVEIGQRIRVGVSMYSSNSGFYRVVEEPLPAGVTLVPGSLKGQFSHHEVRDGKIVMYYPQGKYISSFNYELVGYSPGRYRVLPTVLRDAIRPGRMRLGKSFELRILGPDEESDDPYVMNNAERFTLGQHHFKDGDYGEAIRYLAELYKLDHDYNERELARMLLWIYATPEHYDAKRIVTMFEILRERYPSLYIPFDKILVVGRAYHDLAEYVQAYLIYRATIDASFIKDSNVSALLQDEGQLLSSIDYQENLWYQYPDTAAVVSSYFALSQLLYQQAPNAHTLKNQRRNALLAPGQADDAPTKTPTRVEMLGESIRMLHSFLTFYATNPLADDAAFSISNAFLDLKQYETVTRLSDLFKKRYDNGEFTSGFQYMGALGQFWRRNYKEALTAARVVADGKSKDRDYARYILGQIYHAQGKPGDAIEWYTKVRKQYADADEAINYFERKSISMEEVNIFKPSEDVTLKLKYRNIKEAVLQVYKVDLMKLYLREKNLSNITAVNLAGISPQVVMTIELGDGKDYIEKRRTADLGLEDEGAYLVICRGDDLFTSGLVLITPLTIEVQEDTTSGRIRANVINDDTGQRPANVHVKAIGSQDQNFRSGETDLRGLFIADAIRGEATIIAREGTSRYAFYRGDQWLGAPANNNRSNRSAVSQQAAPKQQQSQTFDYQMNLRNKNSIMQQRYLGDFERQRRSKSSGVQIELTK